MREAATERMLRVAYSAALYLLLPVTLYHLIWRGFRQPAYFQRWRERYASYTAPARTAPLWLHAVSVGEVNAAAPLVERLLAEHPQLPLVITTITPTGSERVRALWGERVAHVYLPYDLPGAVARFLDQFRPSLALIVETELWPNLLFGCRDRGLPVCILNARLSAQSLRGYRVLGPLIRRALATVRLVAAQSAADAARFVRLGAPRTHVVDVGNLKFDMRQAPGDAGLAPAFAQASDGRPAWIAASTHPDEEVPVLQAHLALRRQRPGLQLLWAPRHPERFGAAAARAREAGLRVATRSADGWPDAASDVFVIDTLGELAGFYGCARVAFVGGSLQPVGGHNLLEPAAAGAAIVSGPHLHNFADIAARLRAAAAMRIAQDAAALPGVVGELLDDAGKRQAMTAAASRLLEEGRGALERTCALIGPLLPVVPADEAGAGQVSSPPPAPARSDD